MKNKIAIIILAVVVIVGVVVIGFYFSKQNKQPAGSIDSIENTVLPNQTKTDNQTNSEQAQNKLITNDFEIDLPAGWQKAAPPVGTSAMAVNTDEKLNDPAAKKINFRSYFAVSYDTMEGKSLSEYTQTVKSQLQQTIPNTVFAQEHDVTINGKAARAFEADLSQQGMNFKILMVAIEGSGDDVWIISFNALQNTWTAYQKTFSDIANSFKLKLKN